MSTGIAEIVRLVRAGRPHVTVIGDAILDRWLRGTATRLSREGPVPVVEVDERDDRPGGAANTAANLAALGASVQLLSAVGDDPEGRALLALLREQGVDTTAVAVLPGGVTAVKTRVVGAGQILVRADVRAELNPAGALIARWREVIERLPAHQSLLVCDYGGGLFGPQSADELRAMGCRARVIVDAHDLSAWRDLHPDVVTPNWQEASPLLAAPVPAQGARFAVVERHCARLLAAAGARAAVVTLDRDGAMVLDEDGVAARTTVSRPVPDTQATGAGDAFAAALAVALGVGCALPPAAEFAQAAAQHVVSRAGTLVVRLDDLDLPAHLRVAPVVTSDVLAPLLREAAARGQRSVFVNGGFDLLHAGHTAHLEQAKTLGDLLVVALNDDRSVRRLKGAGRPVNSIDDRARVVAALGCVDFVIVFAEDTPARLLEVLRPDVYAKGGDYAAQRLEEAAVVEEYGGRVRILDYFPDHSTSSIVERIARRRPPAA